jgi:ABC-type multidrug transport system fused ATPase/permease subunit
MIGGDSVNPGLQSILEYDFTRINFALETNSLSVYNYFIKNNVISNFFHYELLSGLGEEFENFFNEQKFGSDTNLKNLISEFDKFRNLRMDDLDLGEFKVAINFVEKIIHSEQTHKNVLYHSSIDLTKKKFKNIISSIYDFIVDKNYKGIDEKLNYFETETVKIKEKLEKFSREAKTIVEKIKKESKASISQLEKKIEHNIAILDNKLTNLNTHVSYNPFSAFKNSLTYSFVISLLIFLVAGMASYSNNTGGNAVDFQSSFALFITPGIKWGAVTFLLGFLFAIFSAVSAIMERATQKQKIVQRIGYVKNEKERQIDAHNKKRESDIKSVNENLEEIKSEYEAQIEKLKKDKLNKENEIKKEADDKIKKESAPLKPFLK